MAKYLYFLTCALTVKKRCFHREPAECLAERTAHWERHTPVLRGLQGGVIYHAQRGELPGRAGREQHDSLNEVASILRSGIEQGGCDGHALR